MKKQTFLEILSEIIGDCEEIRLQKKEIATHNDLKDFFDILEEEDNDEEGTSEPS